MESIPSKARVVIIGGGVIGCSVAYHLTLLGWKDVVLLERLYKYLRPWITNHPNMGAWLDPERPTCPTCGSTKVNKKGTETTNSGTYQRYRCQSCRSPLRSKYLETSVEARRNMLRSSR